MGPWLPEVRGQCSGWIDYFRGSFTQFSCVSCPVSSLGHWEDYCMAQGCWSLFLSFLTHFPGADRMAEVPNELEISSRERKKFPAQRETPAPLAQQPGLQVQRKPSLERQALRTSSCPSSARWPRPQPAAAGAPRTWGSRTGSGGPCESWDVGLGQGCGRGHLDSRPSLQRILELSPQAAERARHC